MWIKVSFISLCILTSTVHVIGQTTVTTSGGSTNAVPKFSGSGTIVNSAITESSGRVGIGTTNPLYPLDVNGAIAIAGSTVIDQTSIAIPNDGTYVIAESGRLRGEYTLSLDGPNRVQTTHILISANQYDGSSSFQILDNHSYGGSVVMSNFRLLLAPGGGGVLLVMDVANRNGTTNITEQYQGFNEWGGSAFGGPLTGTETPLGFLGLSVGEVGQVGIGVLSPSSRLEVNGNIKLTSGSGASLTFADGTVQSTAWTGSLCGGDYAESMNVSGDRTKYEPGDVLVLDPKEPGKVLKVIEPYSTFVAGIYSTKPGIVGRRQTTDPKASPSEVPMAMVGVVPTKVSAENGPINVGDLLVTSSIPGHAMKGTDRNRMFGAVVGKATGNLDVGTGVIEVLVSLQ